MNVPPLRPSQRRCRRGRLNLLYAKSLWIESAGSRVKGFGVAGFERLVVAAGQFRLHDVGRGRRRVAVKVDVEFHATIPRLSAKWCRVRLTGPPWNGVTTEPR
jgi:hypothetical protein